MKKFSQILEYIGFACLVGFVSAFNWKIGGILLGIILIFISWVMGREHDADK